MPGRDERADLYSHLLITDGRNTRRFDAAIGRLVGVRRPAGTAGLDAE